MNHGVIFVCIFCVCSMYRFILDVKLFNVQVTCDDGDEIIVPSLTSVVPQVAYPVPVTSLPLAFVHKVTPPI